jgi:hypothetical protein
MLGNLIGTYRPFETNNMVQNRSYMTKMGNISGNISQYIETTYHIGIV